MSQLLPVTLAGINSSVMNLSARINGIQLLVSIVKKDVLFILFRYYTLQVEEKKSLISTVSRTDRDLALSLEERHTIHEKLLSFGIVYSRSNSRHNFAVVFENLFNLILFTIE